VLLAPVHCAPKALSSPSTSNCPSLHHCERSSPLFDEANVRIKFSGMPLDLGDNPPRLGPGSGLIAEIGMEPAHMMRRGWPEPPGRGRRCFLQQARDVRAMDQGGQRRDQQADATIVPNVRRQYCTAPASCARLQPRQFPAHAGDAGADQGLVADESKEKLIKVGAKVVSHGRQMAEVAIARKCSKRFCGSSRS
jgi:hypothetical protein